MTGFHTLLNAHGASATIPVPEWRSQVLLHPGDTDRHTVVYAFGTDRG